MVLRQYSLSPFKETKELLSIDKIYDQLLFEEKLYVFNNDGKRVGRFSVTVKVSKVESCNVLIVHISNRGMLDGKLSETVVTGILTMNLKTMEEIRHESSDMNYANHKRRFYLLRERTKYYYSITESIGGLQHKRHSTIPFSKTIGLIGEAGNIIFMRALVIRGYEGIVSVKTILSNGKRCRNFYITKNAQRRVNGKNMDVVIVYRCITDYSKYNVTSTCTFTKAGQLINLFWSNSEYFLHIDPDLEIYERMPLNKPIPLHRRWHKDKQIYSLYLDEKVEIDAGIRSYRMRVQELKRMASDWLQFMFIRKPQDTICATIEFFTSYGRQKIPKCGSGDEIFFYSQD